MSGNTISMDWSDPPPQQQYQNQYQSSNPTQLQPGVFTEKESQVLKRVKRNVDRTRSLGFILGAGGIFLLLTRRSPPKALLARGGFSLLGGIAGAVLMMPLGVMYSKPILEEVEDPRHLAETLRLRVEGRRKDWEQGKISVTPILEAGVNPYKKEPGEATNDGGLDRGSMAERNQLRFDERGEGGNGNLNGSGSSNLNYSYSNTPNDSSFSSDTADGSGSTSGKTSRWEQLRSQRNVQPSSWERIRQDNAREALKNQTFTFQRRNESVGESNWQEDGSSSTGPILADPTFGKGTSEARERERREFQENMERERRGMDSGMSAGSRW